MRPSHWPAHLRALWRALVELLHAEVGALGDDLRRTARQLRAGVVLLMIAAFFGFWTVGALAYATIELLSLWLPRLGAVLVCLGSLALVTLILVLVGRARLRRLESPARTVAKRIESHKAWLREEVLPDPEVD